MNKPQKTPKILIDVGVTLGVIVFTIIMIGSLVLQFKH